MSILPTLLGKQQEPKEYIYFTWRGTGVSPHGSSTALLASRHEPAVVPEEKEDHASSEKRLVSGYGVRYENALSTVTKTPCPLAQNILSTVAETPCPL
jgi:hypothetical protein